MIPRGTSGEVTSGSPGRKERLVVTAAAETEIQPQMLGGSAALAEGAWLGSPQGADVLESLHTRRFRLRLPRISADLVTREYSIPEATVLLMVSFFTSAFLGAVRQVLFNAQFGAGDVASAYYAAFRLPDALFS